MIPIFEHFDFYGLTSLANPRCRFEVGRVR